MAGVLAPIYTEKSMFGGKSESYLTNPSSRPYPPLCFPTKSKPISPFALNLITMAQPQPQNTSPEIKEPTRKIQKIDENGVHPTRPAHYFRVKKLSEKAILPSRGSPLSAGYDLSGYSSPFFYRPSVYVCVYMCVCIPVCVILFLFVYKM